MHDSGFLHDETVRVKFSNILAGVGVADFGGFIGIEPDFALATAKNFGGKRLLGSKVWHLR